MRISKKLVRKIHARKRYSIVVYAFLSYCLLVILIIKFAGDPNFDKVIANKRVNDITALNPIHVAKQIQPTTVQEIVKAVKNSSGPISIGGGRFSMGGQTAYENSLHIDMRKFNRIISLDTVNKQIKVEPGIVWRDIQKVIDPHNLSVKIMQTYANFTVGGSISVNCHGRYIGHGPIVSSVLGLTLVTASGELVQASRTENADVFAAAIGGYGGVGVIVEVTLQLADNVKVSRQTKLVAVEEYNNFFNQNIRNDPDIVFQNGDLYPPDFDMINSVAWKVTDQPLTDEVRVTPEGESYWLEQKVMSVVASGSFGKWFRRNIVDPYLYSDEKVVWRNREASYDVQELEPKSRDEETYVLQEYFIPVNNIRSFIPKMKAIYDRYDVNVINVSLRHAYPDKETFLAWAAEEVFAFVVYYKQGADPHSRDQVREWTVDMTDAILSEGGRWYLPYQPHASVSQFRQGYVRSDEYFAVKNRLDPSHRFTNKLLDKYNPFLTDNIEKKRDSITGYYRDEAQTFLTVPEWYLVFNPKEYADHLDAQKNPSDFPFYASIDEYWTLYDRSKHLVSAAYPENAEYNTMLDVIGVSITMEYTSKMLYENTVGRLFSWFSNGTWSDEEKVIAQAHRAYSDMIYDKAWYEFQFLPWVTKVWAIDNTQQSNWLRKVERKMLFTVEFTFKAAYATLIGWAAKSTYEPPVTDIFILAEVMDSTSLDGVRVVKDSGGKQILAIGRWGKFTSTMLKLKENTITIREIGGNDEIVVSIIAPKTQRKSVSQGEELYTSRIVTDERLERRVYLVPVSRLLLFMEESRKTGAEVEHIFDY